MKTFLNVKDFGEKHIVACVKTVFRHSPEENDRKLPKACQMSRLDHCRYTNLLGPRFLKERTVRYYMICGVFSGCLIPCNYLRKTGLSVFLFSSCLIRIIIEI
jgi:hypothetical protein